ncbi:hypothetical protein [Scytonema sp. NUACC26]|uniref:hypothetical protein n=1 Tax=Scytonema sp. NUACC26 TaxID=3140176 RepID=UPI0034DC2628
MNKTEIEKLLREVTNFAESMKLNFGNAQVIRQEIAKIVDIQKQLNQINTKVERKLKLCVKKM